MDIFWAWRNTSLDNPFRFLLPTFWVMPFIWVNFRVSINFFFLLFPYVSTTDRSLSFIDFFLPKDRRWWIRPISNNSFVFLLIITWWTSLSSIIF
jgi:hypothetical protein